MATVLTKRTSGVFKKGETIFREGDIGEEMYIIKSGRVEVVKKVHDEEVILAELPSGSFFGEMALFGDKHRSATVRAIEQCAMAIIDKKILDSQLRSAPDWFVAIMRTLVQRLKETNKRLKSRYTISLEYSLLKTIFGVVLLESSKKEDDKGTKQVKSEGKGLKAELGVVAKNVQAILSVSKEEMFGKLRDFSFVHLIKFSEEKNEIFIPDEDKLLNFLLFLQAKVDKKIRLTHAFDELKNDPVSLQYFERIYRLLARKKGLHDTK